MSQSQNSSAGVAAREQNLAVTAVFIAMTYVFTFLVNIRLPLAGAGGLIHLGNVPLFLAAFLFGKKTGALAGGIGMGLYDLTSGWASWAPFTVIIVGLMGYTAGLLAERRPIRSRLGNTLAAILAALAIKIVGCYLAEVILTGNLIAPLGSIPGNVLQVSIAGVLVLFLLPGLRRAALHLFGPLALAGGAEAHR